MKRLLLTLAVVMLSCSAFAQTQAELYDRFNEAISRYDIDGAAAVIDEWEKAYPGDAEIAKSAIQELTHQTTDTKN